MCCHKLAQDKQYINVAAGLKIFRRRFPSPPRRALFTMHAKQPNTLEDSFQLLSIVAVVFSSLCALFGKRI
jgi:hypothetical protein